MSVSPIGSSTTSGTTLAELQEAQRKLAADIAAKATDKVIAADKAAVTKTQQDATQQIQTTHAVDVDL
jgi:F0F1-type ATP synthase assembly protein I